MDEIWAEVEQFRRDNEPITIKNPGISIYFCPCGGDKVQQSMGLPVCTSCGLIDKTSVDETAEWTSGPNNDGGTVKDAARCGMPNDNELFSEQWGAGLVINSRGASYEIRRMAKISFHSSMNHKDRSLFHAYKDIELAALTKLNLPGTVIRDAKVLYKKFNGEKLTRGAIRRGIKANCVLNACRLSNISRSTAEIATAFGIPSKDISRTAFLFNETILGEDIKKAEAPRVTRPKDLLPKLFNDFEINEDIKQKARIKATKMSRILEPCVDLMSKTPISIASVIILLVLGTSTNKKTVCEICKISAPTLTKIQTLVEDYLEKNNYTY